MVIKFHIPTELRKLAAGNRLSRGMTPELLAHLIMPEKRGITEVDLGPRKRKVRKPRPVNREIVELERMYRAKDPRER